MQNYRFNLLEERCSWWDGYIVSINDISSVISFMLIIIVIIIWHNANLL
jgi:hypothetical protein